MTTEFGIGKVTKQDILRQKVWVKLDSGKEIDVSANEIKDKSFLKIGRKK